jgi:hypothetical protein
VSTQKNLALLINKIIKSRKKKNEKKIFVSLDLKKAFDSISRVKLFEILRKRAVSTDENHIVNIIIKLF